VPKNTVGTHSPLAVLRRIVSVQAHWRCSSPLAVLKPIVSALTHCQNPAHGQRSAHGQCSGPLPVLKRIASAPAHCRYPGPLPVPSALPVLRPMVGTQAHCQCPGALSVLKRIVGAPAHGRYSSALSVPGPWSVPTQKTEDRSPAPRYTRPNKGVQATANSVRSFLAPAICRA